MNLSSFRLRERYAELFQLDPGNKKIYFVGGVVRDLVLGRQNSDIDLLCDFDTRSIARRLAEIRKGAFYVLDETRNTCRVIVSAGGVKQVYDFARQQGHTLLNDLTGRDFTINAMAIAFDDPDELIDPLHSLEDIDRKVLRACSPASFTADPVRVIRAVRYAVSYQLDIEPGTQTLLLASVDALAKISGERKRDEFYKILATADPLAGIKLLQQYGILPELGLSTVTDHEVKVASILVNLLQVIEGQPCTANDEFGHILPAPLARYFRKYAEILCRKNSSERSLHQLLILCAILGPLDSQAIRRVAEKLVLSNEEMQRLILYRDQSDLVLRMFERLDFLTDRDLYLFFAKTGPAGLDLCLLTLAQFRAVAQETRFESFLIFSTKIFETWFGRPELVHPIPLLNGNDLMMQFDLTPGPMIGRLIEDLKEEQAAGQIKNRSQALDWAEERINQLKAEERWKK